MSANTSPITDTLKKDENKRSVHAHGSLDYPTIRRMEQLLPSDMLHTAETGCGRSTILFSQISKNHSVFCLDDRSYGESSSIHYFEDSTHYQPDNVSLILGPTQKTLPQYQHNTQYDCVLIDGPHGYPFPDLEYYFFYPHIRPGGFLIIDDIQIPSIGRMADILQEDAMWEFIELFHYTAFFRRTEVAALPSDGDHWWQQGFNQRRCEPELPFHLTDGGKKVPFAEQFQPPQRKIVEKRPKSSNFWRRLTKRILG